MFDMLARSRSHAYLPDAPASQRGFSIVELLVVVSMIVILTTITVFSLSANKAAYGPDDEATQVVSYFREAYQRALSQRQTHRVQIDRNSFVVRLLDEGLLPGGDEVEVIRGTLNKDVTMEHPSLSGTQLPTPPAPYNYGSANFVNGVWSVRFRADGSVVDADGDPVSATLFFAPRNLDANGANLIRAVTVFGPSGSVRAWRYDSGNNAFIAGVN
jgi:prepilin-type N-terminal cleavage/methylation domain-containing protein